MEKKEFAIAALDLEHEIFVVYVAAFNNSFDIVNKVHF